MMGNELKDGIAEEAAGLAGTLAITQCDGDGFAPQVFTRLATSKFFEYEIEGELVILTDELRAAIEAYAGAELIEAVNPKFQGETRLMLPQDVAQAIQYELDSSELGSNEESLNALNQRMERARSAATPEQRRETQRG